MCKMRAFTELWDRISWHGMVSMLVLYMTGELLKPERIAAARAEISHVTEFNYVIINDKFDQAVQDLISIVRARRLLADNQLARHSELIKRMLGAAQK